jgi:hypothetical protein
MKARETHPGLHLRLQNGSYAIKRTDKPFSRQPINYTLETTTNADAANKLTGISHMTNSISARQRWSKSHSKVTRYEYIKYRNTYGPCARERSTFGPKMVDNN